MLKKNYLILLLAFLTVNHSIAQILKVNKSLFDDDLVFNGPFIKINKIKSITGSRSSKKVNDIIRQKGLDYQYIFNINGTLKRQWSTFYTQKTKKDTQITSYEYRANGTLILKRKSDEGGYFSYNYLLDSDNNIIKQTYCRDENTSSSKSTFKLGKQYTIKSDSFSYTKIDEKQTKKIFYNSYGKRYKEQTTYYNEYGYLTEEYTKFIIGNNKSRVTYEYNENGRISKIDDYLSLSEGNKITHIYSYDEIGNLLEIKIYNNDKYTTSQQYLYDKKTMLLTAQLIKDIETEFIKIIQYNYIFY